MPQTVDEIILRAMEEGKFDELPGKGKPLNLDENPHEDPSWRLAYHILKTSGFTLPWIESLHDIDKTLQSIQAELKVAWNHHLDTSIDNLPAEESEAQWQRAMQTFLAQIEELNKTIRKVNLEVPNAQFQLSLIDPEREISKVTQSR
jgi:DnaJ family protein C protein 28